MNSSRISWTLDLKYEPKPHAYFKTALFYIHIRVYHIKTFRVDNFREWSLLNFQGSDCMQAAGWPGDIQRRDPTESWSF